MLVLLVVGLSAFVAFFSRFVDRLAERLDVDTGFTGGLMRDGVQLVLLAIMALLLYRFVPARRLSTRGTLAGAVLTAVCTWSAAKVLQIVFADFSNYNIIYGSLAGVMTFLFFVYIVALILLLGAEFAYAWSQPAGPPGPPTTRAAVGLLPRPVRTRRGRGGRRSVKRRLGGRERDCDHLQMRTVRVASASRPRTSEATAVRTCLPLRFPPVRQTSS